MMTDLLNKLSYDGAWGWYIYATGCVSLAIGVTVIMFKALFMLLRVIGMSIINNQIDLIADLLIPKYFNTGDFTIWMLTPNGKLNGKSPAQMVGEGNGMKLYFDLGKMLKDTPLPQLYDEILSIPPLES